MSTEDLKDAEQVGPWPWAAYTYIYERHKKNWTEDKKTVEPYWSK